MKQICDNKKVNRIIFDLALLVYAGLLFYLYYNQLLFPVTGRFESDTAIHVRFAVEDHYYHSLAAFIYVFLSWLPFSEILIATVLTIATVGAIIGTKFLILKLISLYDFKMSDITVNIIAFSSNILMAFYIKSANSNHYIGYECANMWHNSTYTFMKVFAIFTVIYFIDAYNSYKEEKLGKKFYIYSILLTVTTGFKASFLTVFAPFLALLLLRDLIKKTPFMKVFAFALSIIPSLIVLLCQNMVLSSDSGNGYAISPFTALALRGAHPKITLVLSVLFPLLIFFTHIKDFYKDKVYFSTLIFTGIAFMEVFLLVETGERSLDGNFMWGYSIALFFLFLISIIKALKDFAQRRDANKVFAGMVLSVEMLILFWHVLTGIIYFFILLTGVTYFA